MLATTAPAPLSSLVRVPRAEARAQVASFLDSIEVGRYDVDGAFLALVGRFGPATAASLSLLDDFWPIVDRFDRG